MPYNACLEKTTSSPSAAPATTSPVISIRLDALAALRDPARLEQEAPQHLKPGTYLEPFALRALGIARENETLIEQAQERFHAMQLGWHAAQTDRLRKI